MRWNGPVAIAIAALLVAVAPAQAAHRTRPPPNLVYAGQTDQGLPAVLKLGNGRAPSVSATFTWGARCSSGQTTLLWNGARSLDVRNGHFSFRRNEDANGPEITLSGTLGKTAAKGTWSAKFTEHDDQGNVTDTCETGLVNWTLPRSAFGGQTSGAGYPLILQFDKKLTRLQLVQVVSELKCDSGKSFTLSRAYGNFILSRAGAFGEDFPDNAAEIKDDPHPTFAISFHGKLGRSNAKGTWQITAVLKDAAGNQVDSCDSGPLRWSAAM